MEGIGVSHHVTFHSHYSYTFEKGHCSPIKLGVTEFSALCTSRHKECLSLGLCGDGEESKNLVFQPWLVINKHRKRVCHANERGNSFYVDMADDRLAVQRQ